MNDEVPHYLEEVDDDALGEASVFLDRLVAQAELTEDALVRTLPNDADEIEWVREAQESIDEAHNAIESELDRRNEGDDGEHTPDDEQDEQSLTDEFEARVRAMVNEEYDDEFGDDSVEQFLRPEARLKNLHLSATYELKMFDKLIEKALADMDETPDFDGELHKRKWANALARRIVKDKLADTFDIRTSNFNTNIGIKRRNDDVLVTVVYE